VNRQLREAGLSPLHNISRVIQLESIPVLGTGKTDYRTLKQFVTHN
jgi:long-chain-fatty-acid--[acyl-carrier-protein] ligase